MPFPMQKYHFWGKKGCFWYKSKGKHGICTYLFFSNSGEFPCACLQKLNPKCACEKKIRMANSICTLFCPLFIVHVALCLSFRSLMVFVISFCDFSDFNFISKVSLYCPIGNNTSTTPHSLQAASAKGGKKHQKCNESHIKKEWSDPKIRNHKLGKY